MKADLRTNRDRNAKNADSKRSIAAKREARDSESESCKAEETTEPQDEESEVTQPERPYAYLKGDRVPGRLTYDFRNSKHPTAESEFISHVRSVS